MSLVKSPPNEIRYDPNHAIALIFRVLSKDFIPMPTKKNPRAKRLRYWEYLTETDGVKIKFKGVFLLDVFDLHVLLALVAIAVQRSQTVEGTSTSERGRFLHNSLDKEPDMTPVDADAEESRQMMLDILDHMPSQSLPISAVATCSSWALTKLVTGSTNDANYKRIKESLYRLLHTTIEVTNVDGSRYTSNMVSSVFESKDVGKKKIMSVAVNPVLTQSLRLNTGARYIKLYLDAFASLSQVGKLLYTYLSARVWKDATPREWTTETLVGLIYEALEGEAPVSRQAASKRLKTMATAMRSLNNLDGWKVVEKTSAKGLQKWIVTRQMTMGARNNALSVAR